MTSFRLHSACRSSSLYSIPFHSLSDWVSFSAHFMCVSFAVHHYHRVLSFSLSLHFLFPEETSLWLEFRSSSHSLIVVVMQDCLMIQATTTKDRGRRLDTPCTLSSSLSLLLFVAKFAAFAVFSLPLFYLVHLDSHSASVLFWFLWVSLAFYFPSLSYEPKRESPKTYINRNSLFKC